MSAVQTLLDFDTADEKQPPAEARPAAEEQPTVATQPAAVEQSEADAQLAAVAQPVAEEAPDTPRGPYTFSDHKEYCNKLAAGELTAAELKATFQWLVDSKSEFIAELVGSRNAQQLKVFASRLGCLRARENKKAENAEHVFGVLLRDFSLEDSVGFRPFSGETLESATAKQVEAVTDEALREDFERRKAARVAHEKAMSNPETLPEFRKCIRDGGEEALSDEQLAQFDALAATESRQRRFERQPSTVSQIESDGALGLELTIKEGYHDRRQCPVWIVQLSTHVERETFNELKAKAKMLGGWYSSFKKADAGFQFLSEESAEKFAALLGGDADRTEELEARKARKEESAAERLSRLADALTDSADEILEADTTRLKNTSRRADMAAGMRGRAFAELALAETMNHIALALDRGEAGFLDGLRQKTHVQVLNSLLKQAKDKHVRESHKAAEESGEPLSFNRREADYDRPADASDIRFAEYPTPRIYKRHLEEAIAKVANKKGCKQAARQWAKRIQKLGEYISFGNEHAIEELLAFISRIKGYVDTECLERGLENYKRLRAANIHTVHELRAALRDLLRHRGAAPKDDPVITAEDELRGKKLPGFFPTPRSVIERMLELAEIEDGHRVLEPSCGKGDILDAVTERCRVELTAIEQNRTLQAVLEAKGYEVRFEDFLEVTGEQFDRVLMNPPFGHGADIEHVRHAHSLLAPGGVLVSVMCEGPFFRSDKQSTAFREWLDEVGAENQNYPRTHSKVPKRFGKPVCEPGWWLSPVNSTNQLGG